MRTTIELPDPVFREVKAVAARRGVSLKILITTAVEAEIRKDQIKAVQRATFPLLDSSDPGTLNLSNADIEDLLT